MHRSRLFAAALSLALASIAPLHAAEERSPDAEVLTSGFLYAHPDLKHRLQGMALFDEGKHEDAYEEFLKAARWADKFAQAMVAEMLWNGTGTQEDRASAYAWMDLAAERGYPSFVAIRERYWSELDESARRQALEVGEDIYAQYGDAVAKPRLATRLRRERTKLTGSRTGFVGALEVLVPSTGGWKQLDGGEYYASHYWQPDEYFAWQDRIGQLPPQGVVQVGPLSQDDAAAPKAAGEGE